MFYWLRWLAVVPAALGAYIGVQVLIALGHLIENEFTDDGKYWSQFFNSIAGPYCLVWAGAKTAPRCRFATAVILTVLHGIATSVLVALVIIEGLHESASLWWGVVCCALGIGATILACMEIRSHEHPSALEKVPETNSPEHESQALQTAREMPEEEAVQIAVDFAEVYATCNEERWLFKPQSLLPREPDTVVRALKVSYQTGYPFPEQLEDSYRHCFPQIAFFVPDDQFDRAMAYFERLRQAIKNERHHSLFLNFEWAGTVLNCARGMSANGDEFKDVFETTFLADAPADPDKFWVQQLARDCWRDFRSRIAEWSEFVPLVKAGETGLEPKDVALARIELNKTRREIDDCIPSLRPQGQKSTYAEIITQID